MRIREFSLALVLALIGVHGWQSTSSPPHLFSPFSLGQTRKGKTTTQWRSSSSRLFQSTAVSTDDARPEILLYNSKSRKKEPFQTLEPGKVKMYTCGPTVYDSAHVGNFRAFLTYDVLKRMLAYFGYDVDHVCNLTDVDDKIIKRCTERSMSVEELTLCYEQAFMDDLTALNIIPANKYPRATQHINDMMEMIEQLAEKELAYQSGDGSWWFATQNQEGYGTHLIQNLNVEEMESQERTSQADDLGKRHPQDFCLWKAYKEGVDLEEATWTATPKLGGGKGRPGWHLECSAMARRFLGETIDVHAGGVDLKFPHHENEIAQSEGATGKVFCNCWIHNGFVNIGNEKMSKSKGNFLTLRAACPKAVDVRAYRYLVVSSQYRNPLSFTEQAMSASKKALKRMDAVQAKLDDALKGNPTGLEASSAMATKMVPAQLANFEAALLDDLSMPRASASLFALIKAAEGEFKKQGKDAAYKIDVAGLAAVSDALMQMDKVFGIFYDVPLTEEEQKDEEQKADASIPNEVLDLVGQRSAAKESKDWELADSLRNRITELGFAVKDVKGGDPIVSRLGE